MANSVWQITPHYSLKYGSPKRFYEVAGSEALKAGSLPNPLYASGNYMFLLIVGNKIFGSYLLFTSFTDSM